MQDQEIRKVVSDKLRRPNVVLKVRSFCRVTHCLSSLLIWRQVKKSVEIGPRYVMVGLMMTS